MKACVVVPARNEEVALPNLVGALAAQLDLGGMASDPETFEVLLLLNNCTDNTAKVARLLQSQFPHLRLHVLEIAFAKDEAHVGRARQALFDLAFSRFETLGTPLGLILTTDADSRPAPDWIAQNEAEIAAGVDGVGGRITLERAEVAALPEGVLRLFVVDIGYRRALEELRSLYDPNAHDAFPRHHQHFGGSLAVTAAAYEKALGMPLRRTSEDVAMYRAILASGGRFRHSYRVKVHTSARMVGRAQGGLADAISWWNRQAVDSAPVMVESAADAEIRCARLGLWRTEHPELAPPASLCETPEPASPAVAVEIHQTLRELREIISTLRPLSLASRLARARLRLQHPPALDAVSNLS